MFFSTSINNVVDFSLKHDILQPILFSLFFSLFFGLFFSQSISLLYLHLVIPEGWQRNVEDMGYIGGEV